MVFIYLYPFDINYKISEAFSDDYSQHSCFWTSNQIVKYSNMFLTFLLLTLVIT